MNEIYIKKRMFYRPIYLLFIHIKNYSITYIEIIVRAIYNLLPLYMKSLSIWGVY